jgi:hypothetical protein
MYATACHLTLIISTVHEGLIMFTPFDCQLLAVGSTVMCITPALVQAAQLRLLLIATVAVLVHSSL